MNIVIVTQEDPFYIPLFFEEFMKIYKERSVKDDICLKGVVIQEPIGQKSMINLAKKMLGLYGARDFIKQGIRYATNKVETIMYLKNLKQKCFSIEYFARNMGTSTLQYKDVNSEVFINFLKENKIDLIVSVSASQIFKKQVMDTPRYGCINIHNAPLPKYRGMLPNFWQMYYDEEFSVTTIHKMVEELDRGDILNQVRTKINEQMTLDELIRITKKQSAHSLWDVLVQFTCNTIKYHPIPNIKGSYHTFPTKEDVRKFKAKGKKVI